MAKANYVETLLGSVPAAIKTPLVNVLRYILDKGLRVGRPDDRAPSENFAAYFYRTTTPAIASTEFTIAHGLGRVPYLLTPVLAVETPGMQIVPLTVTRAADEYRVYLSSTATSAPICLLLEA